MVKFYDLPELAVELFSIRNPPRAEITVHCMPVIMYTSAPYNRTDFALELQSWILVCCDTNVGLYIFMHCMKADLVCQSWL